MPESVAERLALRLVEKWPEWEHDAIVNHLSHDEAMHEYVIGAIQPVFAKLEADNARLRDCLKPFARYATLTDRDTNHSLSGETTLTGLYDGTSPTLADCRRAAEVIKETES